MYKRGMGGSPLTNNTRVFWYQLGDKYGYEFIVTHVHSVFMNDDYYGGVETFIDVGAIYATWEACYAAMTRLYVLLEGE